MQNRKDVPPAECIKLNDKGADLLIQHSDDMPKSLKQAIVFLNQAIACDSNYVTAYLNLAIAYDRNEDYKNALKTYNKMLSLGSNKPPELIIKKGEIFEKMGEVDSANRNYRLAHTGYKDSLAIHPKDTSFIDGYLFLTVLTEGNAAAIKELNKQIAANPELARRLNMSRIIYQDFDRKSYLYHTPTVK